MSRLDPTLWDRMMAYLRRVHGTICRQWFETLRPERIDGGLLRIFTDNRIHKKYLQSHCIEQFQEAAQAVTGALVAVRFVASEDEPDRAAAAAAVEPEHVDDSGAAVSVEPQSETDGGEWDGADSGIGPMRGGGVRNGNGQADLAAPATAVQPGAPVPPRRISVSGGPMFPDDPDADEVPLHPDHAFENFVTGPANRLAYAAAVAVANAPGHAYNPLFIHGGVGLGKTHLLQAICQAILGREPDARICYISCDTFMTHYLDCVQRGLMTQFRYRYRHVDMLVIDDIHFLARRESSQEEFFHTFNALHQTNKQIVLSSDSPPSELPELEERLVSRFGCGLVAHVGKPSYEMRVAIVRSKARLRQLKLQDDVIEFIASRIDTNARELEGALNTLQGHAALQEREVDLALACEVLGEPAPTGAAAQVTLQKIVDVVTAHYGVKLSELQSKRRHRSISEPRQACMWLARKRTRFSLQEIGMFFGGRDHTTVMHGITIVDQRLKVEPDFKRQIESLEEKVLRPGTA